MIKRLSILFCLMLPMLAHAEIVTTATRSAGKLINDNRVNLAQKLQQSPIIRSSHDTSRQRQARTAQHAGSSDFYFFDGWVEMSGDDDGDGYFHHLKVSFDADTYSPHETVYAKLFLSYQGGPWVQYADTDLFEINYDSMSDSYQVETDLLEGYRSGDYDVLIELHSLYHTGVVASLTLYQDVDGFIVSLEDRERDRPDSGGFTSVEIVGTNGDYVATDTYYAGSLAWPGLIFLTLLLAGKRWIRR